MAHVPVASGPEVEIRRPDVQRVEDDGEVWRGLLAPLPRIDPKHFYDDRGSRLFERITRLPEYYQTRTEEALLEEVVGEILDLCRPRELVELGSGAGRKIRLLLAGMRDRGLLDECTLLEINETFLTASAERLAEEFPGLEVVGVVGDFHRDLVALGPGGARLILFLAGTFGNLEPPQRTDFLAALSGIMAANDRALIGLDLVKDRARLEAAYNDAAGVTAEFNRNCLRVLNARYDTDFEPDGFEHVAFWNEAEEWIEMRLRATAATEVRLGDTGRTLRLAEGEEIRTELSCKFTRPSFQRVLAGTGLGLERWLTDPDELFALAVVQRSCA